VIIKPSYAQASRLISRRAFLLGSAAIGCSRKLPSPPAVASAPPPIANAPILGKTRLIEWTLRTPDERVAVLVPDPLRDHVSYRVVMALHGRGESLKPPPDGALGWPRDYSLTGLYERISNPPLTSNDFQNLVDDEHLTEMNRALAEKPFGGLIVVCPYLPDHDAFDEGKVSEIEKYLIDVVLARAKKELPISSDRTATGIDGVSLGGITALQVGLARPDIFGVVGALQPAIRSEKIGTLTTLASKAKQSGALPKLRLTTSRDDYYRAVIAQTDASWTAAGITHDFSDLPGPHDYIFNRGPGGLEMLFWQDRTLAITNGDASSNP
jgi:iron(III)-salmochelin esterase